MQSNDKNTKKNLPSCSFSGPEGLRENVYLMDSLSDSSIFSVGVSTIFVITNVIDTTRYGL